MRTIPSLLALACALLIAVPAGADHCASYSNADPTVDVLGKYYVALYVCDGSPDCMFSLWVYEESNGIPGLQRGDEEQDDTCHRTIESDTIIF